MGTLVPSLRSLVEPVSPPPTTLAQLAQFAADLDATDAAPAGPVFEAIRLAKLDAAVQL